MNGFDVSGTCVAACVGDAVLTAAAVAAFCKAFCGKPNSKIKKPNKGQIVYRVYGDGAGPGGRYWTPANPFDVGQGRYRNLAGLPDVNSGEYVIVARITEPKGIKASNAPGVKSKLYPDCCEGGLPQYYIPDPAAQLQVIDVLNAEPNF